MRYFLILTFLIGCGGGSGGGSSDSSPSNPLIGNWISSCDSSGSDIAQVTLQITADTITTLFMTYSDTACENSLTTLAEVDSYRLPGGNALDKTVESNEINSDVVGQTYYTISEIKDNVLYLGDQTSDQASDRPTNYDLTMGFKKE